jgi:hypothetical protein
MMSPLKSRKKASANQAMIVAAFHYRLAPHLLSMI